MTVCSRLPARFEAALKQVQQDKRNITGEKRAMLSSLAGLRKERLGAVRHKVEELAARLAPTRAARATTMCAAGMML